MKRLRALAFSVCWEIGDTFIGWALRLDDSEQQAFHVEPPVAPVHYFEQTDGQGWDWVSAPTNRANR